MRSLPPSARARRRSFLSSGGITLWNHFRPQLEILEDRRMLACEVLFRDGLLSIQGDERDNVVEVTVGLWRVSVSCDEAPAETFNNVQAIRLDLLGGHDEAMINAEDTLEPDPSQHSGGIASKALELAVVEAGSGDDQITIDDSAGLLSSINFAVHGGEGNDVQGWLFIAKQQALRDRSPYGTRLFDGGEGEDKLLAIGSERADLFDIAPGAPDGSIQVGLTDIATNIPIGAVVGVAVESVVPHGGDGNDHFRILLSPGLDTKIALALRPLGEAGDDVCSWFVPSIDEAAALDGDAFDGGEGNDQFQLIASDAAELIEIIGIPDREIPDPLIRVTDLATGNVAQEVSVFGVEAIDVEASATDEFAADNREGGLGKPFLKFKFATVFTTKIDWSGPGDEGPEESITLVYGKLGVVNFIGGAKADRYDIRPGASPGSFDLAAIDIQRGRMSFQAQVSGAELVTVKAGDGNDAFNVTDQIAADLHLLGQKGDDICTRFGVDVGRGFGGGSLVYDGGEGEDRFQLIATDAAEQIEILGVEERDVPDPHIIVTDLATGQVTADVSIENAEAIAVDSAGGDDRVTMRDDNGPLANVNWTLITGLGNDKIDAVLQSNPNEFFVEAGLGDDDVSIRFVGIPNLPEPGEPMPVIDVDMGAGVDGLLLDIFGSRASPPVDFAAAGISPSVTLLEVLTEIFITGVGLLALLTLFPLGSMEMQQAIQDDRTGHIKESAASVAMVLDGMDLTADVKTGAAADEILIGLLPQPQSHVRIDVASGAGDDKVDVRSRSELGPIDLALEIDPGSSLNVLPEGGDQVVATFEHGDFDKPFIIGTLWNPGTAPRGGANEGGRLSLHAQTDAQKLLFDLDLLGTAGGDTVRVDASSAEDSEHSTDSIIYGIDISGSMRGGDDSFTYSGLNGPPVRVGTWILDSTVDLGMGPGNDKVSLMLETPAEEVHQDVQIDTGDGADGVTVLLRRLANPHLPPSPEEPPGLDQFEILTGLGNDTIDVQLESAAAAVAQKVHIDSGDGDDRVQVTAPEAARDGLADLIVGADAGIPAHVKVFDGRTSAESSSIFPYGGFTGGVRVASGDVSGDGVPDVITAAGPGAGPHVKVFDGRTGAEVRSFFAYGPSFLGGVHVGAGDVNGDGRAEIITAAGAGAPGGHVRVFDGRTGAELQSFLAFPGFTGGVTVAGGDVNGDGRDDIIVGAGPGATGGHVKVFDGRTGGEIHSFLSFPGFAGGVFVSGGDVSGDGFDDIIVGADAGAPGGHVKVFSGATGAELASFFAYETGYLGGVRVGAGDVNGDGFADIVTGTGAGAPGGHVKVFDGRTGAEVRSFFAFDPSFSGGVFVAAGDLHSSHRVQWFDEDLAINTSGGSDTVAVQLAAAATQEQVQKVRIATGDGVDRAKVFWTKLQLRAEFPSAAADVGLDMGSGNDTAEVEVHGNDLLLSDVISFDVRLGDGNDVARYWVYGTELPPTALGEPIAQAAGQLGLHVLGGKGSDDIAGRIGSDRLGQRLPLVLGEVNLEIDGGAGRDRVSLDSASVDDLIINAIIHGGDGNDQVRARFEVGPGSTGQLSAQVFGDAGNDELGLAIFGSEQLDEFFALLDGGKGRDKCRVTKNVIVRNCER